uniref:Uncharacterized protein n=1 Tax=Serinus canaria TaxID=9135 RepID=A0A8C9MT13_SERCA
MAAAARLALLLLGCVGYISYCPDGWSYYKLSCAHLAWVEDAHEAATLQITISYHQRVQPVWIGLQKSKEVRRGRQG